MNTVAFTTCALISIYTCTSISASLHDKLQHTATQNYMADMNKKLTASRSLDSPRTTSPQIDHLILLSPVHALHDQKRPRGVGGTGDKQERGVRRGFATNTTIQACTHANVSAQARVRSPTLQLLQYAAVCCSTLLFVECLSSIKVRVHVLQYTCNCVAVVIAATITPLQHT